MYQSYLLAIEAGYDLTLGVPVVNFDVPKQRVIVDLQLGIKLPRNIVARIFDVSSVDTPLASNPSDVVVWNDYPEEFRSAPRADPYPGHAAPYTPGSIQIQFPVAYATFGQGKRLFAQTMGVNMSNVSAVDVELGPVAAAMRTLANTFARKVFSYLIANEAGGYDLTPMIGNLNALSITVKEPPTVRIGAAAAGSVVAYAANILPLNNTGDPNQLKYLLDQGDFCVSFSEAMFSEIISYLYIYDPEFPIEYDAAGLPSNGGPVNLEQPVLQFLQAGLRLNFAVHPTGAAGRQTISATIECVSAPPAPIRARISDLQWGGDLILDDIGRGNLTAVLAYHVLGAAAGPVLSSILQSSTHNSLDAGLPEFLRTGALCIRVPNANSRHEPV